MKMGNNLSKGESRRNEASGYASEVFIEALLKSKGFNVERITDEKHHNLREKEIREILSGREDCDLIIETFLKLRKEKRQLQDFICRDSVEETVFFVENKEWYKKGKIKLRDIKQKHAIKKFFGLGYNTLVSTPHHQKPDGSFARDQMTSFQTDELLKIKREDKEENEEKSEIKLKRVMAVGEKGELKELYKIEKIVGRDSK